jgi:UDP:flavonoid glycosyltransferase YjiC (YdhE family)
VANVQVNQFSVHPNVKLFMTHGGLLSGQEAMFNGVPVIGIPIFGDQRMNVERAENEGYGVLLAIKNITKETVLTAINKGLNDKGQVNYILGKGNVMQ